MIRQLTRPLLRPLTRPLVGKGGCERWAYNFDGVNDYAQFAQRLIDPDGDNTFEFLTASTLRPDDIIFSQNITSVFSQMEFLLYTNSFNLALNIGGTNTFILNTSQGLAPNTRYKLEISGNLARTYNADGDLLREVAIVRGAAREPTAPTRICVRGSGPGLSGFFQGLQYNIRINDHLYPINNPASPEQRSVPDNGNPLTLFNTNQGRWSKIPC